MTAFDLKYYQIDANIQFKDCSVFDLNCLTSYYLTSDEAVEVVKDFIKNNLEVTCEPLNDLEFVCQKEQTSFYFAVIECFSDNEEDADHVWKKIKRRSELLAWIKRQTLK